MDPADDVAIEEDDGVICTVCYDGTVFESNEIIICEKCEMAVHQRCYDVDEIPDDAWYCDVCALGEDSRTAKCELCTNTGGSYKETDRGKYVHSVCSNWIPDIFVKQCDNGKLKPTLSHLDKKRFKLRCQLCKKTGACVQCSYGRCTNACHPWCVFENPQGFTKRVVKDTEGETQWEIFCKTHAKCVTEPVKPKARAKMQPLLANVDEVDAVAGDTEPKGETLALAGYDIPKPNTPNSSNNTSNANSSLAGGFFVPRASYGVVRKLSMVHSVVFNRGDVVKDEKENTKVSKNSSISSSSSSKKDLQKEQKEKKEEEPSSYPILTMGEWPGQAAGEALDLAHFWNVVGMAYPDDRSHGWVDFMIAPIKEQIDSDPRDVLQIPPHGTYSTELEEFMDQALNNFGTDRDRQTFLDLEKRSAQHALYRKRMDAIKYGSYADDKVVEEKESLSLKKQNSSTTIDSLSLSINNGESQQSQQSQASAISISPSSPRSVAAPEESQGSQGQTSLNGLSVLNAKYTEEPSTQIDAAMEIENHFMAPSSSSSLSSAKNSNSKSKKKSPAKGDNGLGGGSSRVVQDDTTRIVFDGDVRHSVDFKVKLLKSGNSSNEKNDGAKVVRLANGDLDDDDKDFAKFNVISSAPSGEAKDACVFAEVEYVGSEAIDETQTLHLPDREVVSQMQDDLLCRMIRSDQIAYNGLMSAVTGTLQRIFASKEWKTISTESSAHKRNTEVNQRYSKQRIWKKVASTALRGMRDQSADFNKPVTEDVPASWVIRVDGRPVPPKAEEEPSEPQEDAVCMVCFDGTSADTNSILFCDGKLDT